jgi:hypothetical protein
MSFPTTRSYKVPDYLTTLPLLKETYSVSLYHDYRRWGRKVRGVLCGRLPIQPLSPEREENKETFRRNSWQGRSICKVIYVVKNKSEATTTLNVAHPLHCINLTLIFNTILEHTNTFIPFWCEFKNSVQSINPVLAFPHSVTAISNSYLLRNAPRCDKHICVLGIVLQCNKTSDE